MIDPYFESRIENWARASRVGRVTQKSPTLVIMEMLRLQNGEGEDDESSPGEPKSEKGSPRQKPDAADAALLDAAYSLGTKRDNDPLTALSFMALPVIPAAKMTDEGLFDTINFRFIKYSD